MAGLFDMLGGDEAAMQRQLDEQRAAKFAEQTQEQRLAGMGYKAGAGLGRGLAGAFGVDVQDPTIRRASDLRRAAQEYDITSAEGLLKMANAIKEQYPSDAQQLAQQALVMREKESVINKNNREKLAAGLDEKVFAALAAKATPASVKAAQDAGNDIGLLEVPEAVKVSTYGQVLKDAGLKEGTPEFQKQMQAFAAAELESTRKGKGTSVNVQVKQDEAVTKSNVEAFGKLRDTGIQAGQTLEAVKTIKPLIDQSFAGFASDSKLTAGQIAEAFGIPIKGTSETEQLRSLQNNLKIGNSTVLKGSLSDKDMAILGDAIGQGATTKAGLKGILSNLEKDALINQRQYQKANEYQQKGKLSEYDFVRGSEESRKEVSDKLKRLAELERKAKGQ